MDEAELIELVEQYKFIYDRKHPEFKNKVSRENAWTTIATHLGEIPKDVETRWSSIRSKYCSEIRKMKSLPSGSGATPIWVHLRRLAFLDKFIVLRKTHVTNFRNIINTGDSEESNLSNSPVASPWNSLSEILESDSFSRTSTPLASPLLSPSTTDSELPSTTESVNRNPEPSIMSTHTGKTAALRKKRKMTGGGDLENLFSEILTTFKKCTNEEQDEDCSFGVVIAKSLKQIKSNKTKAKAKIAILQALEEYLSD